MNRNISALVKACSNLNLPYDTHHSTENLVSVTIANKKYLFLNWTTPLNPQSVMQLCQDKDYFFSFYRNVVKMPKTTAFLNPYSDEKYEKYLNQKTVFEIINQVESVHEYPIIVKKNRGSWGTNVFKVENRRKLEKGFLDIFNLNSASFDYVGLSQDYIEIETEFRVIFLNGEYQFAYKKVTDNAVFKDNLSPLHWEGAKAKIVTSHDEIEKLKSFCAPIFDKLMIPFCGLDVVKDKAGEYWLIEANSSPGFDYIIEHEGPGIVISLYENILSAIKNEANE